MQVERSNPQKAMTPVSVVIIGRNEAGNISECVSSALNMEYPRELLEVIYVDTGSTDGTQDIARAAGARVIEAKSPLPCASLGRNTGLKESKHGVIHFVDGDMTIAPGYLKKAVERLEAGDAASVIGRVVERRAETNWISRVLNIDWKKKEEGYVNAPGGGGTFIRAALEKTGGYNIGLPVAEEIDIGIRLRAAGYRICLINDVMATHDYGVNSVWELALRYYGSGRGRFRILVCRDVPREIRKSCWKLPRQAAAVLAVITIMLLLGYSLEVLALLLLYPAVYPAVVVMADWKNIVTKKLGLDAFLYTYIFGMMKPVIFLGMLRESVAYGIKSLKQGSL